MMKEQFRLGAGVVEDQRGAVGLDLPQHRRDGMTAAAAAPGWRLGGVQHGDVGVGAGIGQQDAGAGGEEAGERGRVLDRGREADAAQAGGQALQPGEEQGQLVSAFRFRQGVEFVQDHPLQSFEKAR